MDPTVQAPDLSSLVQDYEEPTAEMDPSDVQKAVEDATGIFLGAYLLDNLKLIKDAIGDTQQGFVVRGLDQTLEADIDGRVTVTASCPEVGSKAAADPDKEEKDASPTDESPDESIDGGVPDDRARNGYIKLTAPVNNSVVGPVLFGHASRCRLRVPREPLPAIVAMIDIQDEAELDGPLAVHLGSPLVLGKETELNPLFVIDGKVELDGRVRLNLEKFSFRLRGTAVEVRVPLGADRHVIVVLKRDAVEVREKRGTWICNTDALDRCQPEFSL